jgi:uncharacterized membrane protein YoaK (UPF0700 family)
MTPTKPSLEELTGYLGVGALLMLGVFFLIDGPTNVWITIEQYAKTSSFAILFTVPLLVIAYVLGLIASLAVQTVLERFVPAILSPELFASAAQRSREPLLSRYVEVERHSRLLYGCTLAFLVLAAGSLSVQRWLPAGQEVLGIVCFVLGVAIAAACPILARRLQHQLKLYVNAFESRPADVRDA